MMNGNPKWRVRGKTAIGTTGDVNLARAIWNDTKFLGTGLKAIEAEIQKRMSAIPYNVLYAEDHDKGSAYYELNAILVKNGELYHMDGTLGFEPVDSDFLAAGSGSDFAFGALHATRGKPENRIKAAVKAAIAFDEGCGGAIWVDFVRT